MGPFLDRFDIFVECISLLTTVLLCGFSLYAYHRTHNPRHAAFGFAFFLLSLGLLASVVFNYLVELEFLAIPLRGYLFIPAHYDLFRMLSHMFLLAGFMTMFMIAERMTRPKVIILTAIITLIAAWIGHEFFVIFHLLTFVVLAFVWHHFYGVFLETRTRNARNIMVTFGILAVAEFVYAGAVFHVGFYFAATVLRLLAFALLLGTTVAIYYNTARASPVAVTARPRRR
jgi:hypothetical protein